MLTKGDTLKYLMTTDTAITDWKIRAVLIDANGDSVKIATSNSGGADDQISKETDTPTRSTFLLKFPSGKTNNFNDKATLEVEIDTGATVGGEPEIYTIFNGTVSLRDEKINWTDPDA